MKVPGQGNEECLVLIDATKKILDQKPYCVLLNNIWRWIEEKNDDKLEIAALATKAVVSLGRDVTNHNIFSVIDAVRDGVDDLMKSDIWPMLGKEIAIGEASMTNTETGKTEFREIKTIH